VVTVVKFLVAMVVLVEVGLLDGDMVVKDMVVVIIQVPLQVVPVL
jgi:hypothetical protein